MNKKNVLTVIAIIMFLFSGLFVPVTAAAAVIEDHSIVTLMNNERHKSGLKPLQSDQALVNSANDKALDMIERDYWSHETPDGQPPWQFFEQNGYEFVLAGENLAKHFNTPEGVVNGWMNSPTHRDNILKEGYSQVGVSVVSGMLGSQQTVLVVAHYGSPEQRKTVQPAVSNDSVLGANSQSEAKSDNKPQDSSNPFKLIWDSLKRPVAYFLEEAF